MKFLTSSTTLANKLSTMAKVMSTKAVRPILSSFLFELDGEILRITASDGESIHNSTLAVANIEGTGKICVPADRLLDALKTYQSNQSVLLSTKQPLRLILNIIMENMIL